MPRKPLKKVINTVDTFEESQMKHIIVSVSDVKRISKDANRITLGKNPKHGILR